MARSWTRAQIRTRARLHADLEGTDVGVLDLRVNELIDAHLCTVYLELVQAGPPDYFSTDFPITTVAGTLSYALPADFLSCSQLLANMGTTGRRPVREITGHERVLYQPPQGAYALTLEYVPTAPTLSADGTSFDGVAGFEEIVCKLVARDMLRKESSETGLLHADCMNLLAGIRSRARRSRGAQAITDLSFEEDNWWLTTNRIRAFRVRAGNIEVYEGRTVWP